MTVTLHIDATFPDQQAMAGRSATVAAMTGPAGASLADRVLAVSLTIDARLPGGKPAARRMHPRPWPPTAHSEEHL